MDQHKKCACGLVSCSVSALASVAALLLDRRKDNVSMTSFVSSGLVVPQQLSEIFVIPI